MAEPAVAPPPVEEPKKEEEPKRPVLDSTKPLRQQVDKMLEAVPAKEEPEGDKSTEEKPKEGDEPKEEKSEEKEPKAPEPKAEDIEEEIEPVKPVDLPPWQKYIVDNLPEIQTVGHTGENGKDKVFTIKRLEDLPEDFEFASRRAEIAFSAALASQEVNARDLLNRYNNEQQQQQLQQFQNQEALDIQADINALQKEGVIDKFKYTEDAPEFNDDPAVKLANDIYDLYKKTNDSYIKDGRTYRITYQDAAYKYLGMRAKQAPAKEEKPDNSTERKQVADKISAPSSAAPGDHKRGMPAGSTMQDVLKLYKMGRI